MEVVPLAVRRRRRRARRRHHRGAGPRAPRRRARPGHRLEPAADLPRAGRAGTARARARRTTRCAASRSTSTSGSRRPPAVLPRDDRPRAHRRRSASPRRAGARPGPDRRPEHAGAALRGSDSPRPAASTSSSSASARDGHIALQRARLVALVAHPHQDPHRADPRDNARFFGSLDDVPRHVLTQGLGTILRARHLLLLATGEAKAEAVAAAVEGPLTASCPASVIQLHPHATVLLDHAAASLLTRRPLPRGLRRQAGLAGPLTRAPVTWRLRLR